MRVLIINTDYPSFLNSFYGRNPGLAEAPYAEQMRARNESLFGVADFYSSNLRALGHEAWDVHANNDILQNTWAAEHGIAAPEPGLIDRARPIAAASPLKHLKPVLRPLVRAMFGTPHRSYEILAAQIRHYKPDVVLNQAMDEIPDDFFHELRNVIPLMVGQVASPLTQQEKFPSYDLVISSLPNFVKRFRDEGLAAELHRFAFEPAILTKLHPCTNPFDVTFVGSLSPHHHARVELIETVAAATTLHIWGQGGDEFPASSPIRIHNFGPAWGIDMFQILHDSRMTLNHHIGIAEDYANNMRLFEATGTGTLLITDHKSNIRDMFEPGKEVITYRFPAECLEAVQYYMEHEPERAAIARAGQARTMRDHNYRIRMQELAEILTRHLGRA